MGKNSQRTIIIRKIIFLFCLLISVIVANAVYSIFQESKNAYEHISGELDIKLRISTCILENETEKLKLVSGVIREHNQIFLDCLAYDRTDAIGDMFRNMGSLYSVDLIFLFDRQGHLAATNRKSGISKSFVIDNLLRNRHEKTGLEEISADILALHFPDIRHENQRATMLCFKSLVHIRNSSGDIHAFDLSKIWFKVLILLCLHASYS